jgi:hypothetical protein
VHLFTACAFKVGCIIEQALTMTPDTFGTVTESVFLAGEEGGGEDKICSQTRVQTWK